MILGGGTGGTVVANRLRRAFPTDEVRITVDRVDVGTNIVQLAAGQFSRAACTGAALRRGGSDVC